jgi:aspergillopepsin I
LSYTPVDSSKGFWTFTAKSYAIGSTTTKTAISGIADTGTTLLLLPATVVTSYYKKVTGATNNKQAGGYTFPCSATLPSFSFTAGTTVITIPGSFINFASLDDGSNNCFGGIQSNAGIGFSIFGDIALKAAFVVFDGGKTQLGWANKKL